MVNFLRINPAIATQLESGGIPVAGISDDIDGQTRNDNARRTLARMNSPESYWI